MTRDIVFIDTETGGFDPDKDPLIEIALIRTSLDASVIHDRYVTKIALPEGMEVNPKAAEINGYTKEKWADAPDLETALRAVTMRIPAYSYIGGHNFINFDKPFINANLKRVKLAWPKTQYHMPDTMAMAWPLLARGVVPNLKLQTLCDHFGISNDNAHQALVDIERTVKVYRALTAPVTP